MRARQRHGCQVPPDRTEPDGDAQRVVFLLRAPWLVELREGLRQPGTSCGRRKLPNSLDPGRRGSPKEIKFAAMFGFKLTRKQQFAIILRDAPAGCQRGGLFPEGIASRSGSPFLLPVARATVRCSKASTLLSSSTLVSARRNCCGALKRWGVSSLSASMAFWSPMNIRTIA